jgi:two-component system, NarL family, nitrate/nitrite response regulator NarL
MERGTDEVVVIDDHELFAHSLVFALRHCGLAASSVQASSVEGVLAAVAARRPRFVLLDLDLGPAIGDGARLLPGLLRIGADVIVVTGSTDEARLAACVEAGAAGVLRKERQLDELVGAVARASAGGELMSRGERAELLRPLRVRRAEEVERLRPFARLTPREEQILDGLIEGRDARQMACEAGVQIATIRTQIHRLLTKLEVPSAVAATALAVRVGWPGPRRGAR